MEYPDEISRVSERYAPLDDVGSGSNNSVSNSDYFDRINATPNTNATAFMMQPPTFTEMSLVKTVVLSVMFVISLAGNSATIAQLYRLRRRKSTINTLILHLAIADLIVTFFCNVTDAAWASTIQWYAGNCMCKIVKFVQVFGLYLSTYIIVIISLDRCCAILDPIGRNQAPARVRFMLLAAWVCSALFALPQVRKNGCQV